MVIISSDTLTRPVLAIGFGLQDTAVGEEGVLGLMKENGTFVQTVGKTAGREFLIVEPILSQEPHRGRVELTATGLKPVDEGEEEKKPDN